MMQPDIPNSFLKLLSEGFDSVEEDRKLRLFAVDSYVSLLQGEPGKLPQRFLQVISWVLGEYSHLKEELEPAIVLKLLAKLLDMKQTSSETKSWVLVAMTKLCEGRAGVSVTQEVSETYSSSMDTVLRQRAQELQCLSQDSELRGRVLFRDTGLEPLEVTYMEGCRITTLMF
ncbi:AP-4 complex subunit epsilon-1-like, partial [Seriola lalandi dorsalis]|uniref:AP-4 complex subunit epsilon-1-like n=1 Tax=Seriola lalandi dorsalis TaxID=1841481 RepID=UPI000C6F557F